jgi:peptidyl-prolyl cis-trans isomerase C
MATALARHILVKTKAQAEQLRCRLNQGDDFARLANKFSTCPSGKKGGDLGEIRKGDMVKPFEDVVFKQPLHKVHGPVKTRFGFHLIEVIFRG